MKKFFGTVLLVMIIAAKLFAQSSTQDEIYIIPEEKDPGTAFLYSLFIPGVGQMHNDQVGKGFAILGLSGISAVLALTIGNGNNSRDKIEGTNMVFPVIFFGTWLYSIIDAPITAQSINKEAREKKARIYKNQYFSYLENDFSYFSFEPYAKYDQFGLSLSYHF